MLEFIADIYELIGTWILYTVIVLLVIYLFMDRIGRYAGCSNLFDKYIEMVMDWIRDAFRD